MWIQREPDAGGSREMAGQMRQAVGGARPSPPPRGSGEWKAVCPKTLIQFFKQSLNPYGDGEEKRRFKVVFSNPCW